MMNKPYQLACACALLIFAACKKPEIIGPENTNPDAPALLLDKMVQVRNGSTTTTSFSYDLTNRLDFYISDNGDRTASFDYDDRQNLFMVEGTENGIQDQYFIDYVDGKPVTAYHKKWNLSAPPANALIADEELTYTLENNRVAGIRVRNLLTGGQQDFVLSYDDHSEVTEIRSVADNSHRVAFSYGTNKSPLPFTTRWVLDPYGYFARLYARHDMRTASYDLPGTADDIVRNYTCTFNDIGFPVTAREGNSQTAFFYQ